MCKREGINNFELVKRFSSENAERWNDKFIQRQAQIFKKQNLKKIWVCGPPIMNETFEKALLDIEGINVLTEIL